MTNKGDLNGTTRFVWGGAVRPYEQRATSNQQLAGWQCLEERDSGGDLVARYTYAPGYIDAVAVQERDLNADDDFLDDDEVTYYHSNTLYSVMAMSDADENVIERYRYDAYGAATVLDADFSADADGLSDVENPYLYTARRLDAESALMQYRNRYYDVSLGRFVSRDPLEYRDGLNVYCVFQGRPKFFVDPAGEGVITVAAVAFAMGRGLSHLILGSYYTIKCFECKNTAIDYSTRAAKRWTGDADSFANWLRTAEPGKECATLCVRAGEHGLKGLKWIVCGVVVKYGISYHKPFRY